MERAGALYDVYRGRLFDHLHNAFLWGRSRRAPCIGGHNLTVKQGLKTMSPSFSIHLKKLKDILESQRTKKKMVQFSYSTDFL